VELLMKIKKNPRKKFLSCFYEMRLASAAIAVLSQNALMLTMMMMMVVKEEEEGEVL
jgi:hypothetical protein